MSTHPQGGGMSPLHPSYPGPGAKTPASGPMPGGRAVQKPQFGEFVTYTENGVEYAAIALKARMMSNYGPDPLLHLLFIRPLFRFGQAILDYFDYVPVGTSDQSRLVQWRFDVLSENVVHAVEAIQKEQAEALQAAKEGKPAPEKKSGNGIITPEEFRTVTNSTSLFGGFWREGQPDHIPTFDEMIKAEMAIDTRIKMPRLKEMVYELEQAKEAIEKDKAEEEGPKPKNGGNPGEQAKKPEEKVAATSQKGSAERKQ
jgi:hypothetical protein